MYVWRDGCVHAHTHTITLSLTLHTSLFLEYRAPATGIPISLVFPKGQMIHQ